MTKTTHSIDSLAQDISSSFLFDFSSFLASQLGLYFPVERWGELRRGMDVAARMLGIADVAGLSARLEAVPHPKAAEDILARAFTVGETYFFRDQACFQALEDRILPGLIRSQWAADRRLRIWCAGCCSGEEPYSLAMLLGKLLPDWERWDISILATDVNPDFLDRARRGVYDRWSFRTPLPSYADGFFIGSQEKREVLPRIRSMVTFARWNLADGLPVPLLCQVNSLDLILCRNVLMYFTEEAARRTVRDIFPLLAPGGWLAVGPSETSATLFSSFVPVRFAETVIYRKGIPETAMPGAGEDAGGFEQPESRGHPHPRPREPRLHGRESAREEAHIARGLADQGRLADALSWCDRALGTDGGNAGLHYLRAMILQEEGDESGAAGALEQGVRLDPDFVVAHYALGNLAFRRGRATEAKKHFETALTLLNAFRADEIVPHSDGINAARLREAILPFPECAAA